jgi:hypothetical protein
MISARIEIPTLHCTEQYDEHGDSEPYLWFAYFFTDLSKLTDPEPVSVFVPKVADVRALFPVVADNQDIAIPPELGTFQVTLEGGLLNIAMLGVVVALLEEDDTPSSAIAAGHNAFENALRRELNNFVNVAGLRPPTDAETRQIVSAVTSSVMEAVSSDLGILSKLCDNQDDMIGSSHAIFFGDALQEPLTPMSTVFELPAIDADAFTLHISSYNPLKYEFVKVGHHHYEFVRPLLRVRRVIRPPCGGELNRVNDIGSRLKSLRHELNTLKVQLKRAEAGAKSPNQRRIQELKENLIPAAQKELEVALRAFQVCHVRASHAGQSEDTPA